MSKKKLSLTISLEAYKRLPEALKAMVIIVHTDATHHEFIAKAGLFDEAQFHMLTLDWTGWNDLSLAGQNYLNLNALAIAEEGEEEDEPTVSYFLTNADHQELERIR